MSKIIKSVHRTDGISGQVVKENSIRDLYKELTDAYKEIDRIKKELSAAIGANIHLSLENKLLKTK